MSKTLLFLVSFLLTAPALRGMPFYYDSAVKPISARPSKVTVPNKKQRVVDHVAVVDPSVDITHADSETNPVHDDGRLHHYHFTRFRNHRRRALACFITRSILVITHLCWLILELLHVRS